MKQIFKGAVQKFLEKFVAIKLKRTRPIIVGVTGSFGKTSTKDAIYEVLKTKWHVYKNPKSLNTEIGLLLAVLEQPSGFSSPVKWAKILAKSVLNSWFGKKYDFLILEYGADKPGDIEHLVKLVKPDIGIITKIARVHQAEGQFKNEDEIFGEKRKLADCLSKNGIAILNAEDDFLQKLHGKLAAKTFWFSSSQQTKANIWSSNAENVATGFSATIYAGDKKSTGHFSIPGTYHLNVLLPALMCGLLNGVTLEEGILALENFHLPPGRMGIIEGKNESIILDGSYNASPETVAQAIKLLRDFPGKKKIAVLGNMNELGEYSILAHKEIAKNIGLWLDQLITVGQFASLIAEESLKYGFPESRIKILLTADEAGKALAHHLAKENVILFKGSQNKVRLERAIKMIMAHPEQAKNLLCRQDPEWEKIQ